MVSENVLEMIPKIQQFFTMQPVKRAWLFGSCSRGEESSESDVDILVEYDRNNARISLMTISGMMMELEDILHRNVDLVEEGRLLPFAAKTAQKDKLLIYERKN